MNNNAIIFGLIGYPIKHSLSPVMHNTAFQELDMNARYELFPLKETELDNFFEGLRDHDSLIRGLNVTYPYKEKVISYIDSLAPFAKKILAINTIVITEDRKLIGYNTDGPGFLTHLTEAGFQTKGKRVVLLGAGGAARAIISVLSIIPEHPDSILVYDIDSGKADSLISELGGRIDLSLVKIVHALDDLEIDQADLLINATPVGMKKDDICLVDPEWIHSNMTVYDLVYDPPETVLLQVAKERGAKAINGLGMLFYQGVLAFQHWTEVQLDDRVKKAMRKSIEQKLAG